MAESTNAYLGLDAETARQRAAERGWEQVRAVPPGTILTMEYIKGRINFQVENGKVTRCWTG